MLILTRMKDQRIIINNGTVVVTVVEISGNSVKLGIDAPAEIPIHREEVQRRVDRREKERRVGT
jgi:carbon storage regulator